MGNSNGVGALGLASPAASASSTKETGQDIGYDRDLERKLS